jgi:hypothetical protein
MITAQDKIAIAELLAAAPPLPVRQAESLDTVIGRAVRGAYARLASAACAEGGAGTRQAAGSPERTGRP